MKIVIIEDEYLIAEDLEEKILEYDSSFEILASLTTVKEAIHFFENNPHPDLIFSDIQLPDGLSFEIFNAQYLNVPIIFCTAFNKYALDAFKVNGIDYILKPYEDDSIEKALDRVMKLRPQKTEPTPDIQSLLSMFGEQSNKPTQSILVHKGDKIYPMKSNDVAMIMLEDGISYLFTFSGERHQVDYSMDRLQKILGSTFYRANRQYLVNVKSIDHVAKYFSRKLLIHLTFDFKEQIVVSKAKSNEFLRWLENPQ